MEQDLKGAITFYKQMIIRRLAYVNQHTNADALAKAAGILGDNFLHDLRRRKGVLSSSAQAKHILSAYEKEDESKIINFCQTLRHRLGLGILADLIENYPGLRMYRGQWNLLDLLAQIASLKAVLQQLGKCLNLENGDIERCKRQNRQPLDKVRAILFYGLQQLGCTTSLAQEVLGLVYTTLREKGAREENSAILGLLEEIEEEIEEFIGGVPEVLGACGSTQLTRQRSSGRGSFQNGARGLQMPRTVVLGQSHNISNRNRDTGRNQTSREQRGGHAVPRRGREDRDQEPAAQQSAGRAGHDRRLEDRVDRIEAIIERISQCFPHAREHEAAMAQRPALSAGEPSTTVSRTVTEEQLNELSTRIGADWESLGISLGLRYVDLAQIRSDYQLHRDRVFHMLMRWNSRNRTTATVYRLYTLIGSWDGYNTDALDYLSRILSRESRQRPN
ncbi:Voltage-dependent calcium channel subunit alpha-2/delta-4 [Branchiostoma belcheri]|nr:Voltage-dependent calcium channel subunit alpha-2/delta-4 [Branchiostoma belcheri]